MLNNKPIKEFYDNHWSKNYSELEKDDFRNFEIEAREYVKSSIIKNFKKLGNKSLLEIGPGKGYFTVQFAKMGLKVTAIDFSEKSLNLCRKLIMKNSLSNQVTLINMDAHELNFKSNTFDIIFIQTTLMHLDYIKVINKCKNILNENGLLITFEPLNENPLIFIYRKFFSNFKKTSPKYLKFSDLKKISKNFNKFSFRGFYLISFLSLFLRKTLFFKLTSILLKKIEKKFIDLIPKLEKYCWINVSIYKK